MPDTPIITGLHTVGVPVTDQDAALAFYGALGFDRAGTCRWARAYGGSRWRPRGQRFPSHWSPPTLIGLRAPRQASA